MIQRGLIGDLFTLTRSVIETGAGKYKPLLTLCDALLRMFAGLFADPVDILAIPEVLIGGVNVTLTTLLTPACADAQVFLPAIGVVTDSENRNTSLHLGSLPCVFPAGPLRPKNVTIEIPEVLIGEFLRYALRTERLTPTCADAQVFLFRKSPRCTAFPCLLV